MHVPLFHLVKHQWHSIQYCPFESLFSMHKLFFSWTTVTRWYLLKAVHDFLSLLKFFLILLALSCSLQLFLYLKEIHQVLLRCCCRSQRGINLWCTFSVHIPKLVGWSLCYMEVTMILLNHRQVIIVFYRKKDESQGSDFKDAVSVCLPLINAATRDIGKGIFPRSCLLNVEIPTSPLTNKVCPSKVVCEEYWFCNL